MSIEFFILFFNYIFSFKGPRSRSLKYLEWLINNSKTFKNSKRNYIACINWMIVILQTFVGQICLFISWCTQSCLRAIPLATQLWRNQILNITARRKIVKLSSDLVAKKNNANFFLFKFKLLLWAPTYYIHHFAKVQL